MTIAALSLSVLMLTATGANAAVELPQVIATISVGDAPQAVTATTSGVFVGNRDDHTISVIDPTTQTLTRTLTLPSAGDTRDSLVIGSTLYAANSGMDGIDTFDVASGNYIATIPTGSVPVQLELCGGRMYVANYSSNDVSVIDLTTQQPLTGITNPIPVGSMPTALATDGSRIFVANEGSNNVSVIDCTSNSVTSTVTVGGQPISVAAAEGRVFTANYATNTVSTFAVGQTSSTALAVGAGPTTLFVVGSEVFVANQLDGSISVIDAKTGQLATGFANPIWLDPDPLVAGVMDPLAFARINTRLYVADFYSAQVSVIDLLSHEVLTTLTAGDSPYAIDAVGAFAYVANRGDDTVTVIQDPDPYPHVPSDTAALPSTGTTNLPGALFAAGLLGAVGLALTFRRSRATRIRRSRS